MYCSQSQSIYIYIYEFQIDRSMFVYRIELYHIINVFYYFHFEMMNVKYDVDHHLKIIDVVLNLIYDSMMTENDHVFDDDHH